MKNMHMNFLNKITIYCGVFFLFFVVFSDIINAETASIEVNTDGKVNIKSVLNLSPLSNPPSNPSPGDIYFTTTYELMIYTNGKWMSIIQPVFLGTVTETVEITSSQTWVVPEGTTNINVVLVAGGQKANDGGRQQSGGAGEIKQEDLTVIPGESIQVTIGNSDENSLFGNYMVADTTAGVQPPPWNDSLYIVWCTPYALGYHGMDGVDGYLPDTDVEFTLAGTGQTTATCTSANTFPGKGGVGYGAGGGSGVWRGTACTPRCDLQSPTGGQGAPGYAKITYITNKYERPDGNIFYSQR